MDKTIEHNKDITNKKRGKEIEKPLHTNGYN